MKRHLLFFFLFPAIALISFTPHNKHGDWDDPVKNEGKNNQKCFVEKRDGTIQQFSRLRLVTGVFTNPHLLSDGKIKLMPGEIIAYKADDIFAVSGKMIGDGRPSKVTTDVLPGFATRIVSGTINVYSKKVFNGAKAIDVLYVQCGENGMIEPFRVELMEQLIQVQPQVLSIFKKNKKQIDSRKIQAVAEAYNNTQTITKN